MWRNEFDKVFGKKYFYKSTTHLLVKSLPQMVTTVFIIEPQII
jgi:hypothetical protein